MNEKEVNGTMNGDDIETDDVAENSPATNVRCGQCDRPIRLGEDAYELEQGVLGPRGFVGLAPTTLLCSEACVRGFVGGTDEQIERLPRRIP